MLAGRTQTVPVDRSVHGERVAHAASRCRLRASAARRRQRPIHRGGQAWRAGEVHRPARRSPGRSHAIRSSGTCTGVVAACSGRSRKPPPPATRPPAARAGDETPARTVPGATAAESRKTMYPRAALHGWRRRLKLRSWPGAQASPRRCREGAMTAAAGGTAQAQAMEAQWRNARGGRRCRRMVAPEPGRAARGQQLQRPAGSDTRDRPGHSCHRARGSRGSPHHDRSGIGRGVMWPGNIVLGATVGAGPRARRPDVTGVPGDIRVGFDSARRAQPGSLRPAICSRPAAAPGPSRRCTWSADRRRGRWWLARCMTSGILGPARRRHCPLRPGDASSAGERRLRIIGRYAALGCT